jgi:TonB family protein
MSHVALPSNPLASNPSDVSSLDSVAAVDGEEIFQLVKRGEINPHEVEESGTHQIEVSVLWDRAILHVAHLEGNRSFVLASGGTRARPVMPALAGGLTAGSSLIAAGAATGNYALGAVGTLMALAGAGTSIAIDQRNQAARRDGARFVVDAEVLGGATEMPIVRVENGTAHFVFANGSKGEVEIDGAKKSLDELVAGGHAKASLTGGFEMDVRPNAKYRMTLGGLTITARVVARARKMAAARRRDPATIWAGVGAAGAVATIIASALIATSNDGGLVSPDNNESALQELQHIMAMAHDREQLEQPQHQQGASQESNGTGTAHAGPSGAMGRPDSAQHNRHYTIRRTSDTPQMARTNARERVQHIGIFAALEATGGIAEGGQGPVSPFGGLQESGLDAESLQGNLHGDLPGEAFGYGGLGPVGTGEGGGGDGHGTIGGGAFGTMGHGSGNQGTGDHYGQGVGNRFRDPGTHGPIVRPGHMDAQGMMSPEAIRRVVLRNLGQVTHCHEQGLAANPQLSGRVVVRFVIGGDGNVMGANVSESSVSVPSVASCISDAVRRWQFSAPEGGGTVTVTYPFNLQPAQ